jgi:phosphoadenosine phosphosulfate reductase
MRDIERFQHELHAKTNGFKRKLEQAYRNIDQALELQVTFYCAFSGGVDSTVLLDLLYSRGVRCDVLTGDDGADFLDTLHFLSSTEQRYGFELQRIRCLQPWCDWCIQMGRPDLAEPGLNMDAAWMNPKLWHATWSSLKDAVHHGYGGVFLGLLACESRGRRLVTHDGKRPLYQVEDENGMWHCSPLATWDKRDIWAYITHRNVSYNPVYDTLTDLGIPLERRRVAPLTCFRTMQRGSIVALRQGWPGLYNQLASSFPAIREYS